MYRLQQSQDGTLNGYLNSSLAYFNTSDFASGSAPIDSKFTTDICRYPDHREPPGTDKAYEKTMMYWTILAARLAFVVLFEVCLLFAVLHSIMS